MKEFMLLIRNEIDHQASWSPEKNQQFLKKCEDYSSLGIPSESCFYYKGPSSYYGSVVIFTSGRVSPAVMSCVNTLPKPAQ